VADLHLEKGSAHAERGALLPPYDTRETLIRLAEAIDRYDPAKVIALGDSFHDARAAERIGADDLEMLAALQGKRDWIWIAGNHDPDPSSEVAGIFAQFISLGPLIFRHEPSGSRGEIAGHLHPSARINWRGRSVVRRCFAADGERVVMPAFGAYTGGLSIRDRAFSMVFGAREFTAHVLGDRRLYMFSSAHCL
jgi:hypothetical protein